MTEVSSEAFFWCLQRPDGAGLASTSHDRMIEKDGIRHEPTPGFVPSDLVQSKELGEWRLSLSGALHSEGFSDADLRAGRWSGASFRLGAGDWQTDDASRLISLGEVGAVHYAAGTFVANLQPLPARLMEQPCPQTSPSCRATLGDSKCRVDLRGRRRRSRVLQVDGRRLHLDLETSEVFKAGMLRWVSGANCGLDQLIVGATADSLDLREDPPSPVKLGDWAIVTEGCDGRIETCHERFDNVVNFRGEPHLPGTDYLTRYPGA